MYDVLIFLVLLILLGLLILNIYQYRKVTFRRKTPHQVS